MAEPRFIHLRVHSDFSMVDGLQKIGPIVGAAAANKMPALALTDQMNMCGLVRFYGSAHGKGIKPIVGAEFLVQSDELGDELFCLTLLSMDNDGYQNITLLKPKSTRLTAHPRFLQLQKLRCGFRSRAVFRGGVINHFHHVSRKLDHGISRRFGRWFGLGRLPAAACLRGFHTADL